MIKFTADLPNGRTLLGFGLSRGNFERLRQGHPIRVNLEEMGIPDMDFMIFGDGQQSEAELAAEFMGPDTITKTFNEDEPYEEEPPS